MSPEQFKEGLYGRLVDYWALGCIFYEMMTGQIAFNNPDPDAFMDYMIQTPYKLIKPDMENGFEELSPEAQDIIMGLLAPPNDRLGRKHTLVKLITHKFFTKGQSPQQILSLEDDLLKQYLQNPESLSIEQLNRIPLLPFEPFMKNIKSPWQPPLQDEEDLQYFNSKPKSMKLSLPSSS